MYNKLHATPFVLFALFSSNLYASGFALIEQSASGQGLSYAGAAVSTEDASVMWFNPAGITSVDSQLILAGHIIAPSAKFKNNGSYIQHGGTTSPLYGKDDDGAKLGVIPNFYWKSKVADLDVGLGVNVPFGSTVEYDQNWVGRYHAVYTQTKSININPTIAKKVADNLSLGFGLNAQYLAVNLTQKVDFGLTGVPQSNDGYADIKATSLAFGYNLGAIYDFKELGKLGFSYRSQVDHSAKGDAKFTLPSSITSNAYDDSDITANVVLPASASLSYSVPVGNLEFLADATWTGWSSFDELRIKFKNPAKSDSVQPEDWTDVMRYSLGVIYQLDADVKLRTGIAFDQSPIKNKYLRTPRIADSNRTWLSFGVGYKITEDFDFDFAYTRIMTDSPAIEASDADTGAHVLKGKFDVAIDIVSMQLVWKY
jgi:long-chain fatty acid transport protein